MKSLFQLTTLDKQNKIRKHTFYSDSLSEARALATFFPGKMIRLHKTYTLTPHAPQNELPTIFESLATQGKSGTPILEGLQSLLWHTQHPKNITALLHLIRDIKNGNGFYQSYKTCGFPNTPLLLLFINTGEHTGKLPDMFAKMADHLKKQIQNRRMLLQLLTYPCIVLLGFIALIVLMVTTILPHFEALYHTLNIPLPHSTQSLMAFSSMIKNHFMICILILFFVIAGIVKCIFLKRFQLPLLKSFLQLHYEKNICDIFSVCLNAGIPLLDILTLLQQSFTHTPYPQHCRGIANQIKKGQTVEEACLSTAIFSHDFCHTVAIGEQAGTLPKSFATLSETLTQRLHAKVDLWHQVSEPIIMIFLGGGVAGALALLYFPLFQLGGRF